MKFAINSEAKKFRKALLKINPEDFRFSLFSMYPKNRCEFSSYVLAKYLKESCKYKRIEILTGENRYKSTQRHTWLKVEGFDVDITAYQFSSTNRTVITEFSSCWHQRYRILTTEIPDLTFNQFHGDCKSDLLHDYFHILKKLQK